MHPSDPLDLAAALTPDERARRTLLRTFLEGLRPALAEGWAVAHPPDGAVAGLAALLPVLLPDEPRPVWYGVLKLELGRVDPSLCSLFSVHWGLCRGAIARFGSEAQKARWLGPLARMEALGEIGRAHV